MPDGLKVKAGRLRNKTQRYDIDTEGFRTINRCFCMISANIYPDNLV